MLTTLKESIVSQWNSENKGYSLLALFLLGIALIYHFREPNGGGHALLLPFNSFTWIFLFCVIGIACWSVAYSRKYYYSRLSSQLLVCCILLSVPLLYTNADIGASVLRIGGLWTGFALFIALQQFRFDKQWFYFILFLVVVGVWVEVFRYWYVVISSLANEGDFPNITRFGMVGIFQQRNVFASYVATGLVLSGYLLTVINKSQFQKYLAPLLVLTPLPIIHILYVMSSRAGWFGAVIGVLLILPLLMRESRKTNYIAWMTMIIAGIVVHWCMSQYFGGGAADKEILSFVGPRTILFPQSLEMFLSKPIFGHGYGTFEYSYMHFGAEKYAEGSMQTPPIPEVYHPHNEFLMWGTEGGIVPVIALICAAWSVWLLVLRFELVHRIAIIGLFFPIVLHSQVEFPFYASVIHWTIFILLISFVDSIKSSALSKNVFAPVKLRLTGLIVSIFGILFFSSTIQSGTVLFRFNSGLTQLRSLDEIRNPIAWRDRIEFIIYTNALLIGRSTSNPELAYQYIEWAPSILGRQPRPIFFEYLILAYLTIGNTEEANRVIEEFRFLFPDSNFSLISIN